MGVIILYCGTGYSYFTFHLIAWRLPWLIVHIVALYFSCLTFMFSVVLDCLSVCYQCYSKSYEQIECKFIEKYGVVKGTSD